MQISIPLSRSFVPGYNLPSLRSFLCPPPRPHLLSPKPAAPPSSSFWSPSSSIFWHSASSLPFSPTSSSISKAATSPAPPPSPAISVSPGRSCSSFFRPSSAPGPTHHLRNHRLQHLQRLRLRHRRHASRKPRKAVRLPRCLLWHGLHHRPGRRRIPRQH